MIAQNAELAHGVAWVVAFTAGPDGWDAICWSQFAGVARWTWSHRSGRPTGNIWPLHSSVATSLSNVSFMRVVQYTTKPPAESRLLSLPGRASARPIRAQDAAVARFRPEKLSAPATSILARGRSNRLASRRSLHSFYRASVGHVKAASAAVCRSTSGGRSNESGCCHPHSFHKSRHFHLCSM